MNPTITIATGQRVVTQLRHDPRTVAMLVILPSVLMTLLRFVFDSRQIFDSLAPALLGIFPFLLMFLVTSITTLRERTSGTLERLMTTPMAKLDLLVGYALAFGLVALAQVAVTVAVSVLLGFSLAGSFGWLLLITAATALLGVASGLFASAFARTEFQAIQLMPIVVLPQVLLCGLFHPRDEMATVLRWVSDVLPLSYAVDAVQQVAREGAIDGSYTWDLLVVVGCVVAGLVLAAATLRRQSA